ncbi:MAG: glycosyltransferase, partial [Ignavibacteriae bacterium]|nr:glycosyltransferase [Ignavibacteriota bacterium]
TVIPNPLSFNNNDVEFHDQREKIVLAVGNHGFQKGYDRLLKIWEKVISEHPDWKLNIFGKIDSEMKHLKLAEKLNITESINFFSPTKNIGKEYQKAAIYVMSSRSEGFGMVLIEAMSFGLPCIAFDCPHGPRDIISNGQNGFLIENGNIEEFSNAVSFFIKNEEIRLKMGLRAKKSVQRY